MSLVFNMVGGSSGGGLTDGSALLSVTVPTGSTVTATKSGVTLQTSLWLSGADASTEVALFAFLPSQFDSVNPWTITATDGTKTKIGTVLITTNKEYEITLAYELIIVQDGIAQSGLTLSNDVSYINANALLQVTQNTGFIRLTTYNGYPAVWSTTDKIDVSAYNTMTIDFIATSLTSSPPAALRGAGIGVMENAVKGTTPEAFGSSITAYANTENSSPSLQTVTLDISNYSEMYLVVICSAWGSANSQVDVYDWRVE